MFSFCGERVIDKFSLFMLLSSMNAFKHYYLAIEKLRMKIVECSLDSVFKLNKFSPSCTLFYKAIVKRRPM